MPLNSYNLSGGYDSRVIVHHLDLDLQQGEWLSLVGANGSGKSTFLKLLARILPPITGKVLLDGKEIHCLPPQTVAKRIAILPQQQIIPSGLTVRQLVSLGRTPHQSWYQWDLTKCDRIAVNEALAQTELESYADRPVSQLSGGKTKGFFSPSFSPKSPSVAIR